MFLVGFHGHFEVESLLVLCNLRKRKRRRSVREWVNVSAREWVNVSACMRVG